MTSGTLDRDGFVLRWVREGSGIPAIVVGSERFYRRYFPGALRDHFDIVFCDSRQWVPSPKSFDISTITSRTFCDDIDAVRKAVGFDRPVVIGQSQHGSMVLEYARHQPGDVRGVVAVAAPPPQWASQPESPQEFFERDGGAARRAAHERNRATRRVPTTFETSQDFIDDYVSNGATGWFDPTFDSTPLWADVEVNLPVMLQIVGPQGLGAYDVPVDTPVFLALGRYDYGIPYVWWDEPRLRLRHVRYRLYERSAHHPPYEQPPEFTADLVDWARALPG